MLQLSVCVSDNLELETVQSVPLIPRCDFSVVLENDFTQSLPEKMFFFLSSEAPSPAPAEHMLLSYCGSHVHMSTFLQLKDRFEGF